MQSFARPPTHCVAPTVPPFPLHPLRSTNRTQQITRSPTLSESPIFRRVGSVIPLQVARRYTGNDFGMPIERMMEATATVLRTEPLLARTRKVAAPILAPAPVRVVLRTHPLLVDADATPASVVHTTIRDDYGPGMSVDVRFAPRAEEAPRTLRLALSAHPRRDQHFILDKSDLGREHAALAERQADEQQVGDERHGGDVHVRRVHVVARQVERLHALVHLLAPPILAMRSHGRTQKTQCCV